MAANTLPLDGLVVVSIEQAIAVPFATRQLCDLGARVIKVERPESGDFARAYDTTVHGLSSVFVWLNRGKESIELDITSDEGQSILERLLGQADVFLHNISPTAARRRSLASDSLASRHPDLICGSVSGYGNTGPLADAKAYDLLIQGESGIMSLCGDDDRYAKVGISIADIAGGMYTYASVLAAVHHRARTGEALPVDISLFDSLSEWMSYPMYYTLHGGQPPRRMGISHATIAPYGGFTTLDGQQILIAVQNEREWRRLCTSVLEAPEQVDDPRFSSNSARVANRTPLDDFLSERIGKLTLATVTDRLDAAGIAHARVNSIENLSAHQQLDESKWTEVDTEAGRVELLNPPWYPSGRVPKFGKVPALGEHTTDILAWLDEVDQAAREERRTQ